MSAGFEAAGFRVVAAVEMWEVAAKSFQSAHPAAAVLVAPVEAVSGRRLLRAAGLVRGECAVMCGGPPCPPFSSLSASRLTEDERHGLWREYLRLVDCVLPQWAVIENVPGLLSSAEAIGGIRDAFATLGYSVAYRILDAADFGVPQYRRRAVIIAKRGGGAIPFPAPSHGSGRLPHRTAAEALAPPTDGLTAAEIPALSALATERLSHIAAGESVWDAMPRLPPHLKIKGNGFPSSIYRRLSPSEPSYTVTGSGGGGTLGYHFFENRPLSCREKARLQGFDDGHAFHGSEREIRAQIGNAVPPPLARAVAEALKLG
jgi:DNA (cytosine-5)-methyltransferase 1